jgi:hypothetical protein
MAKSWPSHGQVMAKSWPSHCQVMAKSWPSQRQVVQVMAKIEIGIFPPFAN